MDEMKTIPESCDECSKYIYKGDDEQYCRAARMREVWRRKWQKRPKWCPLDRQYRNEQGGMPRGRTE
jgi:hypothetical protein